MSEKPISEKAGELAEEAGKKAEEAGKLADQLSAEPDLTKTVEGSFGATTEQKIEGVQEKKPTYYEVLGTKASGKKLMRAYAAKHEEYTKDPNLSDEEREEKIKELAEAYRILKNKKDREKYDLELLSEGRKAGVGTKQEKTLTPEQENLIGEALVALFPEEKPEPVPPTPPVQAESTPPVVEAKAEVPKMGLVSEILEFLPIPEKGGTFGQIEDEYKRLSKKYSLKNPDYKNLTDFELENFDKVREFLRKIRDIAKETNKSPVDVIFDALAENKGEAKEETKKEENSSEEFSKDLADYHAEAAKSWKTPDVKTESEPALENNEDLEKLNKVAEGYGPAKRVEVPPSNAKEAAVRNLQDQGKKIVKEKEARVDIEKDIRKQYQEKDDRKTEEIFQKCFHMINEKKRGEYTNPDGSMNRDAFGKYLETIGKDLGLSRSAFIHLIEQGYRVDAIKQRAAFSWNAFWDEKNWLKEGMEIPCEVEGKMESVFYTQEQLEELKRQAKDSVLELQRIREENIKKQVNGKIIKARKAYQEEVKKQQDYFAKRNLGKTGKGQRSVVGRQDAVRKPGKKDVSEEFTENEEEILKKHVFESLGEKPMTPVENVLRSKNTKELYAALQENKDPKFKLAAKELKGKVGNINKAIREAFKTDMGGRLAKDNLVEYLKGSDAMPVFGGQIKDIFINVVMNEIERYKLKHPEKVKTPVKPIEEEKKEEIKTAETAPEKAAQTEKEQGDTFSEDSEIPDSVEVADEELKELAEAVDEAFKEDAVEVSDFGVEFPEKAYRLLEDPLYGYVPRKARKEAGKIIIPLMSTTKESGEGWVMTEEEFDANMEYLMKRSSKN